MWPKRSTAAATVAVASAGRVTSSLRTSRSAASPSALATASVLRPVATTACPAARAAFAMSAPIPRPAPVTNQVCFSLMMSMSFSLSVAVIESTAFGPDVAEPGERGTDSDPLARFGAPTLGNMATSEELREFLATRRARITPQQAGIPSLGHRRVPGLRREEVATLTGVSSEYYTRLERGNANGVSESVLESLARALQLDDAERAHLYNLVRASTPAARATRRPSKSCVRPAVHR